jgi:hypothetical protein
MKSSAAGAGSFVGASSGSCDVKAVDLDLSMAVTPSAATDEDAQIIQ